VFNRDDAMVVLGVGKNMVRAMRHWALSARVIRDAPGVVNNRGRQLVPTEWGESVFSDAGLDPYLEDIATLWLVHWNIVTNRRRNTTWYWTFSYWKGLEFTKDKLVASLLALGESSRSSRVQETSLKRDIDCFIRTYVAAGNHKGPVPEDTLDCPLVELGLISETVDRSSYRFHQGRQSSLPNEIFAYALVDYWTRRDDARDTLSFEDVAYAPYSPGRVFKLDEETLVDRLERLEATTGGALAFDQTAGLRQIYRRTAIECQELLEHHYRFGVQLVGGRA
jgi:hypothetical protein